MALPALIGNWIWKNFGDDVVKTVKDAAKQAWTGVNWFAAAKRYREKLYKQHKEIQIFGQPEPVPLEGIFTHINILNKPSAFRRYDIEALRNEVREDPSRFHNVGKRQRSGRIDGLELVARPDNDRLFVLGKPGAGKTTFLKYLTLQAVKGRIDKIPIFVSLKEWADSGLDLLPFLASRFDICGFPDAEPFVELVLNQGKALVLFDGLDEVDRETREHMRLIPTLTDFCTKYYENQCLVTCRTAATDYTFEGFRYVEVADFNEGQMHAFVRKWFKGNADIGTKFWEEFNKDEHRGLRELGRIPLLLTLLCLAYQEVLSFPQRRVEIYEESLDALLKKWDSSRKIARDAAYHKLSLGHKRQMLACIAAETFETGDYFFRQADLEKRIVDYLQHLPPVDQGEDIDGTAVLKAIEAQHGILVERAKRIYSFAHLTFQEYFTARHVVDSAGKGSIPRLLAHCGDDRWSEVILLTASLLDEGGDFCAAFCCALDDLIVGDEELVAFLHWVVDKAATVRADYKRVAVRGFYCYLALAFDCPLDRDLDRARDIACARGLDHDLDRGLARARDIVRARDLARDLAYALDRDIARARDRALDRARARDRDLAHVRDLAYALGLARDCYPPQGRDLIYALDRALALALDLDLVRDRDRGPELHRALVALTLPVQGAPPKAWRAFADALRDLIIAHRNIGHEWGFTKEQLERLSAYFAANHLLVECLDLLCVSDRAVIENRLLRPPET